MAAYVVKSALFETQEPSIYSIDPNDSAATVHLDFEPSTYPSIVCGGLTGFDFLPSWVTYS